MTSDRPPLEPLSRPVPLAQQAYDWIRRGSLTGEWPPGERMTEEELAERLSMSRTPVREALHRLSLAGIVEPAPGGGYVRRGMSPRDLREHCELRLLLEPEAAALAAQGDLSALEHALDDGAADPDRLDRERDVEFHAAIAEAAGSDVLAALVRTLNERAELHGAYGQGDPMRGELARQHGRIVDALRAGDSARASEEMAAHLRTVRELLLAAAGDDPAAA